MANATALRFGQLNGAGDPNALFLKVWSGEVLTAFELATTVVDKHLVRTITSGQSASFPATWRLNASYHNPGELIVGQSSNVGERIINIDDLLIAPVFIAKIDEAKNHYDVRSIYSTEAGRALARQWDRNVFQIGYLAARATATVTGAVSTSGAALSGGQLINANFNADGPTIAAGVFDAGRVLDEKDIPEADRFAFLRPVQYAILTQTTPVLNRDWGGQGSYAEGKVPMINGIAIVKSNNLPQANVTTGPTAYRGDFTNSRALVMHRNAVGTVKLLDLATEMDYQVQRQGTLIVSKYAVGHGILRPECAVELRTA